MVPNSLLHRKFKHFHFHLKNACSWGNTIWITVRAFESNTIENVPGCDKDEPIPLDVFINGDS